MIEEAEKEMIHSVFHFGDRTVRELMVPRVDVVAIDVERSLRDAHALAVEHGLTRFPAYRDDLDHTEGIVHAKDLLAALLPGKQDIRLKDILRPAHFVPESKRAAGLLRDMQDRKFHLAMVTDEYGAVAGVISLENLLEELVGDIAEEHEADVRDVEALGDGRYRVDATLSIGELADLLGTELPKEHWNTVGGLLFGLVGAIPVPGQTVTVGGFQLTAEKVQGRRVTTVLISPAGARRDECEKGNGPPRT
jgi:CBS domain containing-hemolysin-like protein